jgi:RNase P/RNase MRP subunit p29
MSQNDISLDINQIVRACNGFRDARDDRAFENAINIKFNGKMLILENMNNSEFYRQVSSIKRSPPSRFSLSKKVRNERGLNDLSTLKYADLLPLNEMWIAYATGVLSQLCSAKPGDIPVNSSLAGYVYSFVIWHLELVGAKIRVVHSGNSQLVGMMGLVLREAENVFEILSESNRVRLIPKDVITIKVMIGLETEDGLVLWGPDLAGIGRSGSTFRASKRSTNRRNRNSLSYS